MGGNSSWKSIWEALLAQSLYRQQVWQPLSSLHSSTFPKLWRLLVKIWFLTGQQSLSPCNHLYMSILGWFQLWESIHFHEFVQGVAWKTKQEMGTCSHQIWQGLSCTLRRVSVAIHASKEPRERGGLQVWLKSSGTWPLPCNRPANQIKHEKGQKNFSLVNYIFQSNTLIIPKGIKSNRCLCSCSILRCNDIGKRRRNNLSLGWPSVTVARNFLMYPLKV